MGNCLVKYSAFLSITSAVQQAHQLTEEPAAGTLLVAPQRSRFLVPTSNPSPVDKTILGRPYKDVELHYTISKELGRGQFGKTYMCTENTTGRHFACKSISKSKLKTKSDEDDIKREILILEHLSGLPNVVEFMGAYEDEQSVHTVMEFCAGGELFDRIKARGHYSERDAASIFRAIMSFVDSCHASGVIHGDIKPENFLFSSKDELAVLKAIDFGMSTYIEEGKVNEAIVGSPYYVAPEALQRRYGKEADIWSAGVILYILLCGVPPFWAETEQGIYDAILLGHFSFERPPWPTISSCAKDLICKMLTYNPTERITTAQVLEHPWIKEGGVAPDKPKAIENGCPFKDEAIRGKEQTLEVCTKGTLTTTTQSPAMS